METPEIIIGTAGPYSGQAKELGIEMKQAIELAIKEHNDQAKDWPWHIKLEAMDDKSSVQEAESIAATWINNPAILGFIGHYNSDTTSAASKIYNHVGLAVIAPIASNPLLTTSGFSNVFRYTNRDDVTANAISHFLYNKLSKRSAVVFKSDSPYGNSMGEQFIRYFSLCGGDVMDVKTVEQGQTNFTAAIDTIPATADVLFYGGTFEGAPLLKALRQSRRTLLFAAGDGCWDRVNFVQPAGNFAEAGEGVLVLSASCNTDHSAESAAFEKRYNAAYGPVNNYALNARDAACLLIGAIKYAVKKFERLPTREEVLTSLRAITFTGIANPLPLQWDDSGDNNNAICVLNKIQNGAFKQVAQISKEETLR